MIPSRSARRSRRTVGQWENYPRGVELDGPPLPSPVFEKALAFEDATDLFRGGRDVASRERYMR